MGIIKAKQLVHEYIRRDEEGNVESIQTALDHIDLDVQPGQFIAILGHNGSGKSTLLNIIGGIDGADSGSITIDGERIEDMTEKKLSLYRRKHLGYIFQMYNLIPNLTVRENIEVGAYLSDKPLDVDELLHTLGIYEHQRKLPNQLSGGQQQRVAIARALVNNPKIILADEPTGALDSRSGIQVMSLFQQLNEEGVTIIMITHDANIANHAKKVLHIFDGEIVEDKERKEKQQAEVQSEKEAKDDAVFSEIEQDFGVKEWEGEI